MFCHHLTNLYDYDDHFWDYYVINVLLQVAVMAISISLRLGYSLLLRLNLSLIRQANSLSIQREDSKGGRKGIIINLYQNTIKVGRL